jgi:DNA-binding transcriptional ArsR family regulator
MQPKVTRMDRPGGENGKNFFHVVRIPSMRSGIPLDDILSARSHVRVLRALHHMLPGITLSGREVARRAGIAHPTATAALFALVDLGLVRVRRARRVDSFELNRSHVFAAELGHLFDRESGLPDELIAFLRDRLDTEGVPVSEAYLFGSAARGEMSPASDIDVAFLCSPEQASAVEEAAFGPIAEAVASRFGNRLSPIIASPSLAALRDNSGEGRDGIPLVVRSERQAT